MEIPIIDLAPFFEGDDGDRKGVARLWGRAFETIGFATVVGHRVPPGLMESLQSEARAFFNLPIKEKMRCTYPGEQRAQGYVPMGVETVARTMDRGKKPAPPDLCESMTFPFIYWDEQGKITNEFDRGVYKPNLWPKEPAGLHALIREYSRHAHELALSLMRLSALALNLPEQYFAPFFDRMTTYLRFAYYPDHHNEAAMPDQPRYAAHTDYSGFTILLQDNVGGLQMLMPDGSWTDVHPVDGGLVINSGDLLARWTNDRWKSGLHRVVDPVQNRGDASRLSVVLFTGPNFDAVISCLPECASPTAPPRYQSTTCWDHLMEKIRVSMPDPLAG